VGERRTFREVKTGRSYLSQGSLELIFGLAKEPEADEVEVRWPSGEVERLGTLLSGSRVTVVEGLGVMKRPNPGGSSRLGNRNGFNASARSRAPDMVR
jgi:hypothetical protein